MIVGAAIRKYEGRGSVQPDSPPTQRNAPSYHPTDTSNRLKAQESGTPDCIHVGACSFCVVYCPDEDWCNPVETLAVL